MEKSPQTQLSFLQDKLSLDYFPAYGWLFVNEADRAPWKLEGAQGSLVEPAVDWSAAATLTSQLQQKWGASPHHVEQTTLRELRLNTPHSAQLLRRGSQPTLMAPSSDTETSQDQGNSAPVRKNSLCSQSLLGNLQGGMGGCLLSGELEE